MLLQKHGYLQKVKMSPDCVGTYVANRDGLGLNVRDVAELIGAISEVGFDGDLHHPIAVEIPSNNMSVFLFNKTMWEKSGGFLPPHGNAQDEICFSSFLPHQCRIAMHSPWKPWG